MHRTGYRCLAFLLFVVHYSFVTWQIVGGLHLSAPASRGENLPDKLQLYASCMYCTIMYKLELSRHQRFPTESHAIFFAVAHPSGWRAQQSMAGISTAVLYAMPVCFSHADGSCHLASLRRDTTCTLVQKVTIFILIIEAPTSRHTAAVSSSAGLHSPLSNTLILTIDCS